MLQQEYLSLFNNLCSLDRSSDSDQVRLFIANKAKSFGYSIVSDKKRNIICSIKKNPKLAIQAHYDIYNGTLYRKAPKVLISDNVVSAGSGYLGSSLVSVASLLFIMRSRVNIKAIFTFHRYGNMEGIRHVSLDESIRYFVSFSWFGDASVVNSSSGCSLVHSSTPFVKSEKSGIQIFQANSTEEFKHGVCSFSDAKITKNPIIMLFEVLKSTKGALLLDLSSADMLNFVPAKFKMIYSAPSRLAIDSELFISQLTSAKSGFAAGNTSKIIEYVLSIKDKIVDYNKHTEQADSSMTVVRVKIEDGVFIVTSRIQYANNTQKNKIVADMKNLAKDSNFKIDVEDLNEPWLASESKMIDFVLKEMKALDEDASLKHYHGALECAIIKERYPHINVCAFGPKVSDLFQESESFGIDDLVNSIKLLIRVIKKLS